eukprot:s557_g4.t2
MDKLIPVTSQIREAVEHAGLELDFDLPQIAVVGGQSVGKSTLLEALVGRAFLPTGSGIVTRRPLILQLVHGSDAAEWGEFGHLPGQRFEDFDEIRAEITRDTDGAAMGSAVRNDWDLRTSCVEFAKSHAWQSGLAALVAAAAQGLRPDAVAIGATMNACNKASRWQQSLALFGELGTTAVFRVQASHFSKKRWIWVTISSASGRVQSYKAGGLNSQLDPEEELVEMTSDEDEESLSAS